MTTLDQRYVDHPDTFDGLDPLDPELHDLPDPFDGVDPFDRTVRPRRELSLRAFLAGNGWLDVIKAAVIAVPVFLGGSLGLSSDLARAADAADRPVAAAATTTQDLAATGTPTAGGPALPPDTVVTPLDGDPDHPVPVTAPAGTPAAPVDQSQPAPPPGDTAAVTGLTASGIPIRALQAYVNAADITATTTPGCRIHWSLLAGIGRVESNHGRFAGATINAAGVVTPPIFGPRLDGTGGMPRIKDSDGGRLDGDAGADRAVGPMQFLPGTWAMVAADADNDGGANPQDLDDAALTAARYLCLGHGDLSTQAGRWSAVLRYNHSNSYVALVLALADSYASGKPVAVPATPKGVTTTTTLPPATVATGTPVPLPTQLPAGTSAVTPVSGPVTPVSATVTSLPAAVTAAAPGTTTSLPATSTVVVVTVTATAPASTAGSTTSTSTTPASTTSTSTTAATASSTSTPAATTSSTASTATATTDQPVVTSSAPATTSSSTTTPPPATSTPPTTSSVAQSSAAAVSTPATAADTSTAASSAASTAAAAPETSTAAPTAAAPSS